MTDCIFCKIATGEMKAHHIWENESYQAFLDINPIKPGHILLIPKRHVNYIFDMEGDEYNEIFALARVLAGPIRTATDAERIGIMVEGFKVPHVHVHLVPLYDHTDLNPYNAGAASPDELEKMAVYIRTVLENEQTGQ
jgi:histidine triad (HIT) family protein